MSKLSEEAFAGKVEWEGGVLDALEYGLRAKDLENPDSELGIAWRTLEEAWWAMEPLIRKAEELLEEASP